MDKCSSSLSNSNIRTRRTKIITSSNEILSNPKNSLANFNTSRNMDRGNHSSSSRNSSNKRGAACTAATAAAPKP